jgi:hypothetical protein
MINQSEIVVGTKKHEKLGLDLHVALVDASLHILKSSIYFFFPDPRGHCASKYVERKATRTTYPERGRRG